LSHIAALMRNRLSISAAVILLVLAPNVRAAETPPTVTAPPATPPAAVVPPAPPAAQIEFFETKIRPVLVAECYKCHSAGSEKLKAKLLLDSREGMLKGGESDLPAVTPGKLDDSSLIRAIRQEEEGLSMPPKKKLPAAVIADFEAWVKKGAPMPAAPAGAVATAKPLVGLTIAEGKKFWSFIPPREQVVPAIAATAPSASWSRNEIDRFILAKLEEKKLAPSAPADKRTLIRRATYDLIGLPPTPAEIDAFEADSSPDAFAKVVDRLLASPHYGERWGRYWLDVARYADTKGYMFEEERRFAFSYTYRDWVVRSLNEDLPYDQFLIQQIAADRLDLKDDKRPLAALGFLTLGRRFIGNIHDIIDDRIDVVTRGTMALTVSCARCHDHKYDPIPTADYYSLYGVFASSIEPIERPLIGGEKPPQFAEYEKELAQRKADVEAFVAKRHGELVAVLRSQEKLARYLATAQKGVAPQAAPDFETIDDGKSLTPWVIVRWQQYLTAAATKKDTVFAAWRRYAAIPAEQFAAKSEAASTQIIAARTENPLVARFVASPPPKSMREVAERYAALLARFDGVDPHPDPEIESLRQVLRGEGTPTNVTLAEAGNIFSTPDGSMHRALLQKIDELTATHPGSPPRAMAMEDAPQPVSPHVFVRGNPGNIGKEVPRQLPAVLSPDDRKPFTSGSGRLELAKQIASKENPLTARVMVNRVWQYHFGAGLVRTPSDFGTRGEKPTHPQLLDWLALRFENDDAWSIKKLHKRIMLSAAYQQSSLDRPDARGADPENRLVWRQTARRLDFEAMRDSLLTASGQIDLTLGGRSVDILAEPFSPRRTLYAFIDRQNLPGMFRTFDFASPDSTSGKRFTTSVPQQALFMMNSPFAIQQAKALVARADVTKESDPRQRIAAMYRTVLGRAPAADEIEMGVKFVQAEQSPPLGGGIASGLTWKYGYGAVDDATGKVIAFAPLPVFSNAAWQGAEKMPDKELGWTTLSAAGGHPGNDLRHDAIRRWTAPRDCTVSVEGKLSHPSKDGDGIRARLVTSRDGVLATWNLHHKSADTNVDEIVIKQGETIDFVVDCGPRGDYTYDGFAWAVTITKQAAAEPVAGDDTGSGWNSRTEFSGPPAASPKPLSAWEKYAQVLLESNEFAFVD
jgi:hypothetical protein